MWLLSRKSLVAEEKVPGKTVESDEDKKKNVQNIGILSLVSASVLSRIDTFPLSIRTQWGSSYSCTFSRQAICMFAFS